MIADLVLDVDFDYCIRPTCTRGYADRARLQSGAAIWLGAAELAGWLDSRGLLRRDSFAGAVESHEQVLPIWVRLVESGVLRVPFDVLHVDAHPDLMDLDPALAASLDAAPRVDGVWLARARPGDFLQFAVRLGWVDRIWMLFPDHERERIAALEHASIGEASTIVRKPVEALARAPGGGVDVLVRIDRRTLAVALHTRATLPRLRPPTATVLAHSPEFTPLGFDDEFCTLARLLGRPS
jgi:hypothetical protein